MLLVLVSVTYSGEVEWSHSSVPKFSEVGDAVTIGCTPVPPRMMLCGLLASLLGTAIDAERAPRALGVKVMPNVQVTPGASVEPQVSETTLKSLRFVPAIVMAPVRLSVAVPVFCSVTVCAEVATFTL